MSATSELERLLTTLGTALQDVLGEEPEIGEGRAGEPHEAAARAGADADAIERELSSAPRTTSVMSLRDSQVVETFRSELTDGLIRVDTVNRLLRLVNEIVLRLI
jgi:hypothetical protein